MKMDIKKSLKTGFILFILGTLTLFLQFFFYLIQSNIASTTDWIGYVYYIIAALGHASLFAFIPYILYLPLTLIVPFPRVNQGILLAVYFLLNILAYLNGLVFQLYKFHINGLILDMVFGNNAGDIFVFNTRLVLRAIFTFLFIAGLFAGIAYMGYKFSSKIRARQIKLSVTLLICCIVISHLWHGYAAATNQAPVQNVASCLPQFYPMTFNSLLLKHGIITQDDLRDNFKEKTFNSGICYPLHPLEYSSDSLKKKNIIFIILDSWNPRTFNETTCPNLYNLGKQSQVFTHHLSSSNGTRGSIFGMFFGISSTYWKEVEIANTHPVFIQALQDHGYSIKTFPSASLINPPFYRIIFGDIKDIQTETAGETPFDRDNQLTRDFLHYLDQKPETEEKPFFAFLFYDLLHAIEIPEPYRHKFTPSWDYANYMALSNDMDPTPFFNLYRNCAWHVDSLVGTVIDKLKTTGLLENSILVVSGDHSQEFNENKKNYWGHAGNYSNAQIQVPMIYYDADRNPAIFHHWTTHYDITPTIMSNVLGITNPASDYSMGQQLTDTVRLPFHIAGSEGNYALITKDLISEKKHTGRIIVTDTLLNPTDRKLAPGIILEAIQYKNRFMKDNP